jgi:hypothetical protein
LARLYELKCSCGFSAGVRSGPANRGKFYVFYGCPGCKDIIKFNLHEARKNEKDCIEKGICPKCSSSIFDYINLDGKSSFICPKCGKKNLQMKPTNQIM